MTAREFFYLVSNMRSAQNAYFQNRDAVHLRAARFLENEVDREIKRVKELTDTNNEQTTGTRQQRAAN